MTNAPTTRETADHAELLDRAEKWVAEMGEFDDLNPSRAEAYIHGSLLLSEIAALRGEVDRIKTLRHQAIDRSRLWEIDAIKWKDRATQAERQRDEAVGLLRGACRELEEMGDGQDVSDRINAFLANQGADQ